LNEKFNTDFCKSGKVATEQLTKVLKSNDDLKKSDQAKSLEDFKIGVKKKLTYAVFESYNENTEFYGKITVRFLIIKTLNSRDCQLTKNKYLLTRTKLILNNRIKLIYFGDGKMNKSSINDFLLSMFEGVLEIKNIDQSEMFENVVAKTLKKHNLDNLIEFATEDIFKFQFILLRETDRGVALMAAAYLENSLENLLKKFFVENSSLKSDPFNSYNGFLTSFSSKIDLAFMLGLISNKTKQKLNWIRSIRNDFAHSADFIDFDKQSFADRCNNLNDYKKSEDLLPRDIFINAVFKLSGIIYTTTLYLDGRKEKTDQESEQFDLRKLIPDFEKEFLKEMKYYLENDE